MKLSLNNLFLASAVLCQVSAVQLKLHDNDRVDIPYFDTAVEQNQNQRSLHYPYADIHNTSPYPIQAKVTYASLFCKDDIVTINPYDTWTADSRGICLITKVTALMELDQGDIDCVPYTSSGTSYSTFAVAFDDPLKCHVHRVVSAMAPTEGDPQAADDDKTMSAVEQGQRSLHYPYAHIHNTSPNQIKARVVYASLFCKDDVITIDAFDTWTADSRGVCLITKVTAIMKLEDDNEIDCLPYTSSGTSYSTFAVAFDDPLQCYVHRVVSSQAAPLDDELTTTIGGSLRGTRN